jgi:hypothetical protein
MKKLVVFIHVLFYTWQLNAQNELSEYELEKASPCGGTTAIMNMKGKWEKGTDDINNFPDKTFPRSQYNQVFTRVDKMFELLHTWNPAPTGLEPRWYRTIRGEAMFKGAATPYAFSSHYYFYFCNTRYKKVELTVETGTWSLIFVNSCNWFFDRVGEREWLIGEESFPIFRLSRQIGDWKGMPLYQPIADRGNKTTRAVVLTHDGKLPWLPITQKQFLLGLRNEWEKDKKKELDYFDKWATAQKKEEQKRNTEKFYGDKIKFLDDYLANKPEATLNQPAIIFSSFGGADFKGKFTTVEDGGTMLVRFNPDYFKKDLPRYTPQFMVLYWCWNENAPGLNFKKEFEENFPLEKLKVMIDK